MSGSKLLYGAQKQFAHCVHACYQNRFAWARVTLTPCRFKYLSSKPNSGGSTGGKKQRYNQYSLEDRQRARDSVESVYSERKNKRRKYNQYAQDENLRII